MDWMFQVNNGPQFSCSLSKVALAALFYHVWSERNGRIFKSFWNSVQQLEIKVRTDIRACVSSRQGVKKPGPSMALCSRWNVSAKVFDSMIVETQALKAAYLDLLSKNILGLRATCEQLKAFSCQLKAICDVLRSRPIRHLGLSLRRSLKITSGAPKFTLLFSSVSSLTEEKRGRRHPTSPSRLLLRWSPVAAPIVAGSCSLHSLFQALMEGETRDVGGFEPDFTDEDFAEINAIINLAATSNFEEISEFYESSEGMNYADNARDSEEEGDYVWALERFKAILGPDQQPSVILSDRELALMNAIEVVFPRTANILCVWHIEKNVLSKCKPKFEREQDWETFLSDWTNLVESPDESCFNEAWQRLQVDYEEKEYVHNYIKNTWLPFKEKFVKAWTGNHLHFGNRVTSRAEGAHAMLKRYLTVSTGNFHEVREKICLAIENQHNEIKTKIASEKLRVIHKFRIPMFKELVTHVSIFALSELLKQYELSTSSLLDPCRSQFSNTMGLPCAHFMQNMRGEPLLLSDIHPQWRIDIRSLNMDGGVNTNGSDIESLLKKFHDKYKCMPLGQREDSHKQIAQLIDAEIPLTLEPTIQPHKGRPSGSKKRKGDSSTTRDPSAFEIVEKTRKCSVCHHVGHNRSTCQRCKIFL
ncbi:uncharacterized protein LOC131328770 [Rhododendron vialii]|uniref:uncharacterized protein LOC131328770 n=1 Tax=Rhododendron vialii TaxID=182163 RepID=UPI00265FDE38|nr:uncharacterized protein LOC131328770 [Rhododendron vialii]